MPEKAWKKLNTSISPEWKVCFFVGLIVGILAHFYKITNWLPNWDSLVFRYDEQNMIALGRWFLPVVCSFGSFYDLPFLNGITAIGMHALSAVCICKMLHVQRKATAALIGAVIVSFPAVTSIMMYNYVADGYSIAFFLATLAALYMAQDKPRVILPAILIALSTGIYQAYITVTIMLALLHLVDEIIFHNASLRDVLKKTADMLLAGVGGVVLYFVVLKVMLGIFSEELLDYQGMSQTASFSNLNLRDSLYVVKETFLKCFFDVSKGVNVYILLNSVVLLFTLGFYVKSIFVNKVYKKPARLCAVIILTPMLGVGAAVLAFINPHVDYHNLMLMGYSVFYLFFLLIYERGTEKSERQTAIKRWAVLLIGFVVIANQIVIANVSYHKAQLAYEKSYGALIRIADRIEQTPEAEGCEKILVVGALADSSAYSVNLTPDITGITDGYILRADDETVGQSVLTMALNDYCGKNYAFISGAEKDAMLEREEVKAMTIWPDKHCVAVVDDIIVVKLGAEGES